MHLLWALALALIALCCAAGQVQLVLTSIWDFSSPYPPPCCSGKRDQSQRYPWENYHLSYQGHIPTGFWKLFLNKAHSCSCQSVRGVQTRRGFQDFNNNLTDVKSWSMPLLAGEKSNYPGSWGLLIPRDLQGWSSTQWEWIEGLYQVPKNPSTAPLPTHPPPHAADAHAPLYLFSKGHSPARKSS